MVYHIIIYYNVIKNTMQFYIIGMEWFSQIQIETFLKSIYTCYFYVCIYMYKYICLYLHWTKSGNVYLMC